jgi:hypothetical protein
MMNNLLSCAKLSCVSGLLAILLSIGCPSSARGNVYATSIRLNDSPQDVSSPQGKAVKISYILNEACLLRQRKCRSFPAPMCASH